MTCEVENRLFSLVSDAQTIRSPFKFMMVGLAESGSLGTFRSSNISAGTGPMYGPSAFFRVSMMTVFPLRPRSP